MRSSAKPLVSCWEEDQRYEHAQHLDQQNATLDSEHARNDPEQQDGFLIESSD
jgi:hypothetical protein